MTIEEKRNVLVGIRFDSHTKELLDWAVVKVANPGDRVFAVHVRRNSDATSKEKLLLDDYLVDYEGLCSKKQVDLKAEILKGCSIKKALVKEAISINAAAVIVGISKHTAIGGWLSIAKYCAKHLPLTIEVIAVHNGKVVFQSISDTKLSSFAGDPRPSFSSVKNCNSENQSEFGESEISDTSQLSLEVTRSSEDDRDGTTENLPEEYSDDQPGWPLLRKVVIPKKNRDLRAYLKEGNKKHTKGSLSTISLPTEDFTKQRPGWPLLQSVSSITKQTLEARNMSVVQWAMKLPEHPLIEPPLNDDKTVQGEDSEHEDFKMFSYEELRTLTSQFSPENLIGQGGCSRVYKAVPPEGKPVAVKITNSSTEAWNSFNLEVEIMSTLNHPNIAPLLGNCVEDQDLITVYHFFAKGNLAENLYSDSTKKTPLQWKARFDIAVGVAEALNYLHNKSPRPIIHRDVKSSNILLTPEFKPQNMWK